MFRYLSAFLVPRRWYSIRVATIFRTLEMLIIRVNRSKDRFWLRIRACASMLSMSYLDLMCTLYLRLCLSLPRGYHADNTPPYRKWFLQSLGVKQFHKLLAGFENKAAQAVCTFAYCEGPGHEPIVFQGRTAVRQSHSIHRFYNVANSRYRARSWKLVDRLISVR
jgi:hypothetical protein